MWKTYASNGNGICIEYDVMNYDSMYPVEYINKDNIDYDAMIVNALKYRRVNAVAIIPWVIKNPYNTTSDLDSTKEKEVRLFYCPFDEGELNGGRVYPTVKDDFGYKGIAVPCEKVGLKLSKVIIGDRCNTDIRYKLSKYMDEKTIEFSVHKKE